MNLGKAIKLCRIQRNMNQSDLAKLANTSISHISLLEHNKRSPIFSTLCDVATALNVPVFILILLASNRNEIEKLDKGLIEKLSYEIVKTFNFIGDNK